MIVASLAKLGFDIEDVKVLLNSSPHGDHAGGLGAPAGVWRRAVGERREPEFRQGVVH